MNGVRSTFMRRGYLLTALFALLLLAASPGIASAQSIGFTTAGGTVMEGADNSAVTPGPSALQVSITASLPADDPMTTDVNERVAALGNVAIAGGDGLTFQDALGGAITASDISETLFERNDTVHLYVYQTTADGNWMDEKFNLKLTASGTTGNPVSVTRDVFVVTVDDADVAPVAKFKHVNAPNISLQEASTTTIDVAIEAGTRTADNQGVMSAAPALMAMITPADTKIGMCDTDAGNFLNIVADGTSVTPSMQGTFVLTGGALAASPAPANTTGAAATYNALTVTACSDMANFRDMQVGLSFVATSLASGTDGTVADGGAITITVDSNEATPTVSFATSSIDIDEGGTNTVAILADSELGPEVGTVMVAMSGDAMLSLWQGNDMLEANADGMYAVDLMDSANTILTISADSDRDLEDGMTSMGTLTIESASGANIGDRDSLMVTVNGSTAVPALPLVGQLLLALFLMAGGSRLYRRRRG